MTTAANLALVRRFLEACVRADPDEFAGYFVEDAVWWNAPWLERLADHLASRASQSCDCDVQGEHLAHDLFALSGVRWIVSPRGYQAFAGASLFEQPVSFLGGRAPFERVERCAYGIEC